MAKRLSFWRPPGAITTRSYRLYMENLNPLSLPYPLEGHTWGGVNQNLSDPVTFNTLEWAGGKPVVVQEVALPSYEISREYTLGFPIGALWSAPLVLAREQGGCESNFYAVFACPTDTCYEHFYLFPKATMDAPVEEGDFITDEDGEAIRETTTIRTTRRSLYMHLDAYEQPISGGVDVEIYVVHAAKETCIDCAPCVNTYYYGGGTTLGAAIKLYRSDDRGQTQVDLSPALVAAGAAAEYVVAIATLGDYLVVGTSDGFVPGIGAGELFYSTDRGATFTQAANVTEQIHAIVMFNDEPLAAGAGGVLYRARDLRTFEEIIHTATTENLLGGAFDNGSGRAYFVGENGAAIVYDGIAVTDISTAVGAGGTDVLHDIAVLDEDHLMIVGTTGTLGVVIEGTEGADSTFVLTNLGYALYTVAGDEHRTLVGGTSDATPTAIYYERSPLTDWQWKEQAIAYNVVPDGAIRSISQAENQNAFYMASSEEGGLGLSNLFLVFPCYYDICADLIA